MLINKKSYILAFILFCLTTQIACGQSQNTEKAKLDSRIENLKNQADQLIDAFNKNDFNKFVEMTYPQSVEAADGSEKLISIMKQVTAQTPKIFETFAISIDNPNDLLEQEGTLFGVVPQKIEGLTHQKHKIVTLDCVVGVSTDNGKTWKFASGEKFDELFPSLKGKLQIVKHKTFVDGVEQ